MIGKIVVSLIVVAVGYWYWSGPYQRDQVSQEERQLLENTRNMENCMHREASLGAARGITGVGGMENNGQKLCAEKFKLYLHEGQWLNAYEADGGY